MRNPSRFRKNLIIGIASASTALTSLGISAENKSHGLLLVTNKGTRDLSLVDPVAQKQIATIAEEGVTGHEVAASPDGKRAFVPIYGDAGVGHAGSDGQVIRVMDLEKRAIVGTIDYGKGVRPHLPAFNEKDGMLYVTAELENAVSVIDPKTLKIVGSIPTGHPESHMLVLSHDGKRGYTANVSTGTVSVLDLVERKLITDIKVAPRTQRISISPDDRWVITADQTALRLVVIDTHTNTVSDSIPVPAVAFGTAFTHDGHWLMAVLSGANKVAVIDMTKQKPTVTIDVPKAPQTVLIRPDGEVAYVSCDSSKQVAAIDTKTWTVQKLIDVGPGADGLAWAP
jgi:YVTN family beta-propeller protein